MMGRADGLFDRREFCPTENVGVRELDIGVAPNGEADGDSVSAPKLKLVDGESDEGAGEVKEF